MDFDGALRVVYQGIDLVNGQRPAAEKIPKSPDIVLTGEAGLLDSLGLVTLVLAIERTVNESAGVELDLAGNDAFSGDDGEAQTPASIARLIVSQTV